MSVIALWLPGPQGSSYTGGLWIQPNFNPYRFHSPVPQRHGDNAVIEMLGTEKNPFIEGHDLRTVMLHVAATGERWLVEVLYPSLPEILRARDRLDKQPVRRRVSIPTRQAMNEGELKRRVLGRTRLDGWGVR